MRTSAALLLALVAALPRAQAVPYGYEAMLDWQGLPLCKVGVVAGLASSYDRAGGNNDYNQYQQPAGLQTLDVPVVVTELQGPGVINRFWMPHAAANAGFPVRIIVDGTTRIDTNSDLLLGGGYAYLAWPLVQTLVGGQVSYEPICFENSLRIESNNFASGGWARTHHYYQYNYHRFPPGCTVTPYSGSLTRAQQQARSAVAAMLAAAGTNPAGPSATAQVVHTAAQTLSPGQVLTLANLSGGGTIRSLHIKPTPGQADAQLDSLRLRIRFDGQETLSVDVPVSRFFGGGHGRAAYRSLPLGTDSPDGWYCYWPMPYRIEALVDLYNGGTVAASIDAASLEYEPGRPSPDAGYFHAVYNSQTTVTGQEHHVLLRAYGQGHYVGNMLYVERAGDSRWILEGDDIVTVNPGTAEEHVLFGTGMEDAYNGGYYYNHVLEQNGEGDVPDPGAGAGPYAGLLYLDFFDLPGFTRTRADQYRWLIADYVPFVDGIEVKIENYTGAAGATFCSTAFYYQVPPLTADCNGDRSVDVVDLLIIVEAFGTMSAEPGFNPQADLNADGWVDVVDLLILVEEFGAVR